MGITNDLERCCEVVSLNMLRSATSSTTSLTKFLRTCTHSGQVLPYLRYELLERNRLSYVDRMYGRYHVLLRHEAFEEMNTWASKNRR